MTQRSSNLIRHSDIHRLRYASRKHSLQLQLMKMLQKVCRIIPIAGVLNTNTITATTSSNSSTIFIIIIIIIIISSSSIPITDN
jgi:hypothetical protein